ncbi:MAG TPA: hypothetical protein VFG39_01210, partial [Balneolaceae bacterium]|nr:hypothetical protein [Balneolaceae bacterium]
MKKTPIEKILYGSWRPWKEGGPEQFLEEQGEEQNEANSISLLSEVQIPEPFGRISLAYKECIDRGLLWWYAGRVDEIEEQKEDRDRRYLLKVLTGDLETMLKDISGLRQKVLVHSEMPKDSLSAFVLDVMGRRLMNLLLDLSKRYGALDDSKMNSVEEGYLKLLNMSLPKPSPFKPSIAWYRKEAQKYLKMVAVNIPLFSEKGSEISGLIRELY